MKFILRGSLSVYIITEIPSQWELFRIIPLSASEPMRINPNQFEERFESLLLKNRLKINPIQSD